MRRFAAVAALLAGGCLYTDPINQKPVVDQMAVSPAPTRSDKPVTVTFDVYDPDGDDFEVHARVVELPVFLAGQYDVTFQPSGPGDYTVVVSASDSLGANSGERRIVVTVPNMTPQVGPPVIAGDSAPSGNQYPLGTTFTITPGTVDDDDANPTVEVFLDNQKLSMPYKFRALSPGHYDVRVDATDAHLVKGTVHAGVDVATDRWPCIGGTVPDASTQLLLTAVGETRRLLVTSVDDDLNPWPADSHGGVAKFQWLIGPGDGTFRIVPNWKESYYDLAGSGYSVGDTAQVRVIVTDVDPTHMPNCPMSDSTCQTMSGCPDWVTWNLEFYQ